MPTKLPILLAIDTSGPRLQLAVMIDGKTDILVEEIARGHAEIIFDRIATLLRRNKLGYENLDSIVVTTGPGSFTGLRVGLSTAKGLGLALDIPIVGIPTLTAHSLSADSSAKIAVLVDARREEAYFELFSTPGRSQNAPSVLKMAEARGAVPSGYQLIEQVSPSIAKMIEFAATLDPKEHPADPTYVRAADAKPQQKARIARMEEPS